MAVQRVGQFKAKRDDGTEVTIVVFRAAVAGQDLTSSGGTPPGIMSLKTEQGQAVNKLSKGTYEILDFDRTRVTSDDPAAP